MSDAENQWTKTHWWVLFFLIAIALGVGHVNVAVFSYDDISSMLLLKGPFPKISGWVPHRVIDQSFGGLLFNFYYSFIYQLLIEPFFGQKHIVDIHAQYGLVLWASVFSGLTLLSMLYAKLFVRINIWHAALYSLLFYGLFVLFFNHEHISTIVYAYHFSFLLGLGFLYPFVCYIFTGRDCFQNWKDEHAISFVLILCFYTCFSIFFAVVFIAIALFFLGVLHLLSKYQIEDFQSLQSIWSKIKLEPKWFTITALVTAILVPTNFFIATHSDRWAHEAKKGAEQVSNLSFSEHFLRVWQHGLSFWESVSYDRADYIFFAVVILGTIYSCAYYFFFSKQSFSKKDVVQYFSPFLICVGIYVLFLIALFLVEFFGAARSYFTFWHLLVRFMIVTFLLTCAFKLYKNKFLTPILYLLSFIIAFQALQSLTFIGDWRPATLAKSHLRTGWNLLYTFHCYGEKFVPFYNKQFIGYPYLPAKKDINETRFNLAYYRILRVFLVKSKDPQLARGWGLRKNRGGVKKKYRIGVYYEPSIAKINEKLAHLRTTRTWQCQRIADDIYRIEKINY